MKEKDLMIENSEHPVVLYSEKDDNTWGPTLTGSQIAHEYLDDFRGKHRRLDENLVDKLRNGEISPVYYYMLMEQLTPAELASRVGLSKRKVMKHFKPEHFGCVKVSQLKKYATIFNIPIANLFQIIVTKQDSAWRNHYEESSAITIEQIETNNPYIVETKNIK